MDKLTRYQEHSLKQNVPGLYFLLPIVEAGVHANEHVYGTTSVWPN